MARLITLCIVLAIAAMAFAYPGKPKDETLQAENSFGLGYGLYGGGLGLGLGGLGYGGIGGIGLGHGLGLGYGGLGGFYGR